MQKDIIKYLEEQGLTPKQVQETYERYIWNIKKYEELAEKNIPKEVKTEYINHGINISGECDIESNMFCPSCKHVVGNYEWDELYYNYCPDCGQKLKYTPEE